MSLHRAQVLIEYWKLDTYKGVLKNSEIKSYSFQPGLLTDMFIVHVQYNELRQITQVIRSVEKICRGH